MRLLIVTAKMQSALVIGMSRPGEKTIDPSRIRMKPVFNWHPRVVSMMLPPPDAVEEIVYNGRTQQTIMATAHTTSHFLGRVFIFSTLDISALPVKLAPLLGDPSLAARVRRGYHEGGEGDTYQCGQDDTQLRDSSLYGRKWGSVRYRRRSEHGSDK
ncbi:MAG: hypothetical protein ACLQU4_11055 [Limisphaerales bacterium]